MTALGGYMKSASTALYNSTGMQKTDKANPVIITFNSSGLGGRSGAFLNKNRRQWFFMGCSALLLLDLFRGVSPRSVGASA
jgi:hypothetical protein